MSRLFRNVSQNQPFHLCVSTSSCPGMARMSSKAPLFTCCFHSLLSNVPKPPGISTPQELQSLSQCYVVAKEESARYTWQNGCVIGRPPGPWLRRLIYFSNLLAGRCMGGLPIFIDPNALSSRYCPSLLFYPTLEHSDLTALRSWPEAHAALAKQQELPKRSARRWQH